jgi:hypothetical protein
MELGEKLREESRILARNGKHPEATQMFWGANIRPRHLALTTIASFFTSPAKRPDDVCRKPQQHQREEDQHSWHEKAKMKGQN